MQCTSFFPSRLSIGTLLPPKMDRNIHHSFFKNCRGDDGCWCQPSLQGHASPTSLFSNFSRHELSPYWAVTRFLFIQGVNQEPCQWLLAAWTTTDILLSRKWKFSLQLHLQLSICEYAQIVNPHYYLFQPSFPYLVFLSETILLGLTGCDKLLQWQSQLVGAKPPPDISPLQKFYLNGSYPGGLLQTLSIAIPKAIWTTEILVYQCYHLSLQFVAWLIRKTTYHVCL